MHRIPLRSLSRRLGYKVALREYEELVSIGEYRLAVLIAEARPAPLVVPGKKSGACRTDSACRAAGVNVGA